MGPKQGTSSKPPASPAEDARADAADARALPALTLAPRAPITALRWAGRGGPPLPLALAQARFTLGASGCDLLVPRAVAPAVSARHAVLTRVHSGLRIEDCDSRNGTFRSLGSARLASFQIEAGERFWIADVPVLALDAALEALRPRLAWCLGLDRHDAVDQAIERIADGRPLALVGPAGTDAAPLARAIHDAGPRRANAFLAVAAPRSPIAPASRPPLPSLGEARGGTVFLDLEQLRTVPAPHLRAWFDAAHGVRLIIGAPDERRLRACLDSYRDQVHALALVPLARRPDDLPRLLAIHWRDHLGSERRVDELGDLGGLGGHRWPRNLDELREHAPRLLAYLEHGGVRAAANALGIAHQTLSDHFQRIGFEPAPRWTPGKPSPARELLERLVDWARPIVTGPVAP